MIMSTSAINSCCSVLMWEAQEFKIRESKLLPKQIFSHFKNQVLYQLEFFSLEIKEEAEGLHGDAEGNTSMD